jgi:hypothetical protein
VQNGGKTASDTSKGGKNKKTRDSIAREEEEEGDIENEEQMRIFTFATFLFPLF